MTKFPEPPAAFSRHHDQLWASLTKPAPLHPDWRGHATTGRHTVGAALATGDGLVRDQAEGAEACCRQHRLQPVDCQPLTEGQALHDHGVAVALRAIVMRVGGEAVPKRQQARRQRPEGAGFAQSPS